MKRKISLMLIIVMCILTIFSGCGGSTNSATSSGDKVSDESFVWKMGGVYADGTAPSKFEKLYADTVTKLSGGRLTIDYYSVGKLGTAAELFDMVQNGTVQVGGDWPGYWTGKDSAFDLLGTNMLGLNLWDYYLWYEAFGGKDICDQIYGNFNMKYFLTGLQGNESGIRSNKKIESLEDFKGLKIRMAGAVPSKVLTEIGATPVMLAFDETYEALQRGVVDAMEYSAPANDYDANFHEVTKYWLAPGFHATFAVSGVMFNLDAWNSLPEDLQYVCEVAATYVFNEMTPTRSYDDAIAATEMIDYGVEVTQLPTEEMKELEAIRDRVMHEFMDENPNYALVAKSQSDFMKSYANYREILGIYGWGNTWSFDADK